MITARWNVDEGLIRADATKCAVEILSLGDAVTAEQVLEKGRDPETELHKCFTWDDTIAAEKYRLAEARKVIRLLVIDKSEDVPSEPPVKRLLYKTKPNEGYKPITLILEKPDEYQALLERAKAELRAFKVKYSMLKELKGIFDQID